MDNARLAALLRKHSWSLDLLVLALAAYCLAHAANAAVAHTLRRLPSSDDPIALTTQVQPQQGLRHPLTQLAERNLLKLKRESLGPAGVDEGGGPSDGPVADLTLKTFREEDLQPCTLNAIVRGTLFADPPEASLAVIVRNDTKEPQLFGLSSSNNMIFEDAILVAVRSREVIVRRRDHFERCRGEGEGSAQSNVAMMPPMLDENSNPLNSGEVVGVTRLSATDYRVERSEVDRALGNLNEVATQARIVPSFKNGRANGFKMFAIKPGSIYAKIGLQNGDVIQKINGYDMNSPDRALEIYTKLRDATSLTIELSRGTQTLTMNYAIH